MAKLTFTKLGLKPNKDIKTFIYNNQEIEVKQYLPIDEQIKFVTDILNNTAEDENYANPIKVDFYFTLGIIEYYTNISFTDKQKEDAFKLYDLIVGNGIYQSVIAAIPEEEFNRVSCSIHQAIDAIYSYKNSLMGIMQAVTNDYSQLDLDATEIQKKLTDPQAMSLLKDVMTKLG